MSSWLQSETFWLDVTNIALGLVTLVCLLAVGTGIVQDLLPRFRRSATADDHVTLTPDLGLTMADGGSRIEKRQRLRFWRRAPR
jgi:hypothetical protein